MAFGFGMGFPRNAPFAGGPSLNLQFAGNTVLDPAITFSRGTNATLTDSNGRVAWAPHNLLTNSESFEAAAWQKLASGTGVAPVVTANAGTAPDGTLTADRVVFNRGAGTAGSDISYLTQTVTSVSSDCTGSIWLRTFDGSNQTIVLRVGNTFNYSVSVTGAWTRFALTGTAPITRVDLLSYGDRQPQITDLFIWGAQLNIGSTAQSYYFTTPKNLLGFTQEPENAAWTKSNSYVQQNLLTFSDGTIANLTSSNNTTDASSPISPNFANSIQFGDNSLLRVAYKQVTTVAATAYTLSIFVRMNDDSVPSVGTTNSTGDFGLVFETGLVSAVSTVTSVGGSVYRVSVTITAAGGANLNIGVIKYTTQSAKGFRVTGYQLVQGSTAGDYTQTTSAAAPTRYVNWDGTLTGRKLVENTAAANHEISAPAVTIPVGTPVTYSVFAKAGERGYIFVALFDTQTNSAYFDLNTGQVVSTAGGATANITSVGGGWYRCAITRTASSNVSAYCRTSVTGASTSYTGDGTSGIYVSDFQLSNSASVDPYVYNPQAAAASAAYYGPRFDYDPVTLAAKGLLIEEQRTNLLTYSEQFDNAVWFKSNPGVAVLPVVTANAGVAPDGTLTADRVQLDCGNTGSAVNRSAVTQNTPAISSGASYTGTIYLKAFDASNVGKTIRVTSDTVGTIIHTLTSDWVRVQYGGAASSTASNFIIETRGTYTQQTADFLAWGAQFEAGAFATSYIPTVASQVTRNADSASMLGDNFYTWFNTNQGAFNAEWSVNGIDTSTRRYVLTGSDAGNNRLALRSTEVGNNSPVVAIGTGTAVADLVGSAYVANIPVRVAFAYGSNSALSQNGGSPVTNPAAASIIVSALSIGNLSGGAFLNGHIRRITYYPRRLSNADLQAITS